MEQSNTRCSRSWQYLAAITATLSLATAGSHIGWTSPSLPLLKSNSSHVQITSDEASWIASFYLLGTIPGCILAAFIVDWLGRKMSLLIGSVPLLFGYIMIIMAKNPYVFYAARIISGIGQGIVYVVGPMYIGEISDKDIRGGLGSLIKLMVTFGELYAHAVGPFVSFHNLAYICLLVPLIFFITFPWMPESPYFSLMKNRQDDTIANLKRLKRGISKAQLDEDLQEMQKSVVRDLTNRGHLRDLYETPGNRRAIIISFGLQVILQCSGIAAIESYTQEILEEGDGALPASTSVILLSVLQLIAGVAAVFLVDRLGRRPLLLSTTFLAGIVLTGTSIFYYVKFVNETNLTGYGWILHTCVILYELIIALGLNPLPYMMLGELFSTNIKSAAVSSTNVVSSVLAFGVSKLYQVISDHYGVYTSFGCFACICFFGLIFIALIVPETKGKSLLEIQEELHCKNKKKTGRKSEKTEERNNEHIEISTISKSIDENKDV